MSRIYGSHVLRLYKYVPIVGDEKLELLRKNRKIILLTKDMATVDLVENGNNVSNSAFW